MKPQNIKSKVKSQKSKVLCVFFVELIITVGFILFPLPIKAATGINRTINFQGKIVNKSDTTNIANNSYNFTFKFYDAASNGNQLPTGTPWSETQSLTVTDGIFRATLGSSTPIPTTLNFNDDSIYLDITFNGETFTTRVRMVSVPYALNAEKVAGLTVTNTTGTLTIPNGKTIQFAEAFTTSGAFPLTFTSTNTTNATLPAGTVTLVDLSTSQILTNKTIGSTGLSFSGATTDITTATNENLTLAPNGNGKLDVQGMATVSANLTMGGQLQVGRFGADPTQVGVGTMYYNTSSNKFRCFINAAWADCDTTGGGSPAWSSLNVPATNLSLGMSTYTTGFNWATGTGANNLFSLSTDNSSNGTGYLLNLATGTSSTVKPLHVSAAGIDALTIDASGNIGIGTTTTTQSLLTLKSTTPEIRLIAGDTYYTRLTRAATGGSTSQYNQVVMPGGIGYGLYSDATNTNEISIARDSNLDNLSSFTIEFWIKAPSNSQDYSQIITKWGTQNDDNHATFNIVKYANTNTLEYRVSNGSTHLSAYGSRAVYDNLWHHVVMTYDGTNVNGWVDNVIDFATVNFGITPFVTTQPVEVFARNLTDFKGKGTIDELRIYNRALSGAEVTSHYNSGSGWYGTMPDSGLVGGWHFDENTGTTSTDYTGNGHTATLVSTIAWASGKVLFPSSESEALVWRSADGIDPSEKGIQTFGDVNGRAVVQGQTVRMFTNNTERLRIDNNGNVGIGTTGPVAALDVATSGTIPGLRVNTTGTGSLLNLQNNGTTKALFANSGGLTISGTTTDNVRTTGSDFTAGNLTNTSVLSGVGNGSVVIKDTVNDAAPTTTYSSGIATTQATVGAGAHTILRDDGQYVIIHGTGGSATTASVWDGISASTTSKTMTATVGVGAISLRRPDGRYFLVPGGGATTAYYYDPFFVNPTVGTTTSITIPACTTGTNAFLRNDGTYVILCGGVTNWGTYNPGGLVTAGYTAGGTIAAAFGAGALGIQRDNGTFLVFQGNNTATTYLYNPGLNTMVATGAMTNAPTLTTGAFAIRRSDGKFIIFPGGNPGTTVIYDPTVTTANPYGTFTVNTGVAPTVNLADGAQAIWRPDNTYLIIIGAGSLVVNIYDPVANTVTNPSTNLPNAIGAGVHLFIRPNGQYAIIRGGTNNSIDNVDMGFVVGGNGTSPMLASYESECITSTNLNASSRLFWTSNQEGYVTVQVKSGNGSCPADSSYKSILNSGDSINPGATDNRIQVKFFFRRDIPEFLDQEWGLRKGLSQVRYRRLKQSPMLYDFTVDNSFILHKTQFDLGESPDASTAPQSGPASQNVSNYPGGGIALALGNAQSAPGYQSTEATANNIPVYLGAVGPHNPLVTSVTSGTIVMRRPDGKFMIISGNTGTANAQLYDPVAQTFTAQSGAGNIPTAGTGVGALAVKLPNGKYLIVIGNAGTVTNIYDPLGATGSQFVAGPSLIAATGQGANVIPLPNGRILILHGNLSATSSVYDPQQNTMVAGPTAPGNMGMGGMVIPNPDGTWLVIYGNNSATCATATTTTSFFDPNDLTFNATAGSPALTAGGTGGGAYAFQRSDGLWVIVKGATATNCTTGTTATMIYNPYNFKVIAGPAVTSYYNGGIAIPRADGTWLVTTGTTGVASQIYNEKAGAYTTDVGGPIGAFYAGPSLLTTPALGVTAFQRDDGKFVIITGGAGTVVQQYDGGWVNTGIYKTEQFKMDVNGTNQLDASSTLTWKAKPTMQNISVKVRTSSTQAGLQTASSRDVPYSGGLINPVGGDIWMQMDFSFKRSFPSYGGVWTDVWYSGGGNSGGVYPLRPVATPILTEYSVGKNLDLINLNSDGLSVFRVSSSGDVYTSSTGSINTGGADLAERYTSSVALEPGEVVAIDPINNHGVKKTNYPYQQNLLGVVSTLPGFVAGSYTEDSYPIALVGRVPVKVSTENGVIHYGDYLTASSVPGHAMRATKSGRVLGFALENVDMTKLSDCSESITSATGKCGVVMMFVNLTNYMGSSANMFEASSGAILDNTNMLKLLLEKKGLQKDPLVPVSEIVTDRLIAGLEIISTQITSDSVLVQTIQSIGDTDITLDLTGDSGFIIKEKDASSSAMIRFDNKGNASFSGTLTADTIKANHIEGLDIMVGSLNNVLLTGNSPDFTTIQQDMTASIAASLKNTDLLTNRIAELEKIIKNGSDSTIASSSGTTFVGKTTAYDLNIVGKLTTGLLTIESEMSGGGSMQTIMSPLKLQKDALSSLEIMGGKVVIDTQGNMTVKESITTKELKTNKLTILDDKDATNGAVLATSAGVAEIAAGETAVIIRTSLLTDKSLIFATPINLPTPIAAHKVDVDAFELTVPTSITSVLTISWWIIN